MKKVIIASLIIIGITPFILFLVIFHTGLSTELNEWGAFGSYIGGVYGAFAFICIVASIYITNIQFQTQHEDDVFYKSMESMRTRILLIPKEHQGESTEMSIAKVVVISLEKELNKQATDMAREILCKNPNLIPEDNLSSIVNTVNEEAIVTKKPFSNKTFLDQINKLEEFYEKWDYLKVIFGYIGSESKDVKEVLTHAGYTSFYRAGFQHRKKYYDNAWQAINLLYSEEINLYFRKLDFILNHINQTKRKAMHKKYILSQISKYDIAFIFCYALTERDLDIVRLLFHFDLLSEVRREECRFLLFDSPSEEKVLADIEFIQNRLKNIT
ncbi:MAG: hypothetical protein HGB06_01300 [Chlorobaculum sp.]|jgi:hypothetical protein|nr:hypothetical protein [Chlorobaculum sp.]